VSTVQEVELEDCQFYQTHPDVEAVEGTPGRKPHRLYRVGGVEHRWGAYANTFGVVLRAVVTRTMPPTDAHEPKAGAFRRYHFVIEKLRGMLPEELAAWSYSSVVNSYVGRRRRIAAMAVESLRKMPLHERDAMLRTFRKFEKLDFTTKPVVINDPRAIQPRTKRFNVSLARFTKPIEERVYRSINAMFESEVPSVAKCLTFEERGDALHRKWVKFNRPVAFSIDAKRWDQHVWAEMLRLEHGLYLSVFKNHADIGLLQWLLDHQINNVGVANVGRASRSSRIGTIRWHRRGGRSSGDMNTAVGNVVLVCVILYYIWVHVKFDFEIFDDGDDCVLICEQEHFECLKSKVIAEFTHCGQVVKIENVAEVFEQIKFCQTQPVFDGKSFVMCRDPRVAVAKDLTTSIDIREKATWRSYMATIGTCGIAIAGGLPIWNSFYKRLRNLGGHAKRMWDQPVFDTGMFWNGRRMRRSTSRPTSSSRLSFSRAFGISPGGQESFERYAKGGFRYGSPLPVDTFTPGKLFTT